MSNASWLAGHLCLLSFGCGELVVDRLWWLVVVELMVVVIVSSLLNSSLRQLLDKTKTKVRFATRCVPGGRSVGAWVGLRGRVFEASRPSRVWGSGAVPQLFADFSKPFLHG